MRKKNPPLVLRLSIAFISVAIVLVALAITFQHFPEQEPINSQKKESNNPQQNIVEQKSVREPAVAGSWYPLDKEELATTISTLISQVDHNHTGTLRGLIVPHAGYRYSGAIGAAGFAEVDPATRTVIILGPSHHYPLKGISLLNVTHYKTPIGEIPLASSAKNLRDKVSTVPQAHSKEHSIEIELPFLQHQLQKFDLIPLLVGETDIQRLTDMIDPLLDDTSLLVVSADLSHYHPYDTAITLDTYTIQAILNQDLTALSRAEIDAPWAVASLITLSKKRRWEPRLIVYANSGDTADDKSRVVGYASIGFYTKEINKTSHPKEQREQILTLARTVVESYVTTGIVPDIDLEDYPPDLRKEQGCFVTLNKHLQLRGCIGHIFPQKSIVECVIDNAISAASNDKRFNPVTADELEDIKIEISLLTVPQEVEFTSGNDLINTLVPRQDGVVLSHGRKRSTYLPQVWEQIPNKQQFLTKLCEKGGMDSNCWQDTATKVEIYQAEVFSER